MKCEMITSEQKGSRRQGGEKGLWKDNSMPDKGKTGWNGKQENRMRVKLTNKNHHSQITHDIYLNSKLNFCAYSFSIVSDV